MLNMPSEDGVQVRLPPSPQNDGALGEPGRTTRTRNRVHATPTQLGYLAPSGVIS